MGTYPFPSHVQLPDVSLSRQQSSTHTTFGQRNNSQVFPGFAGNSRARKPNKSQTKRANITSIQYFLVFLCVSTGVNFVFYLLYPLFILLPHYLRQLPFSPRSAGRDTDAFATIAVTVVCLFL